MAEATGAADFLSRRAAPLCALLLALMGAQMLAVIGQKSITVDEWVLIPAGLYHLKEGDYRPVNEHPPVAKVLGAAPLLLAGAKPPPVEPGAQEYEHFLGKFNEFWRGERLEDRLPLLLGARAARRRGAAPGRARLRLRAEALGRARGALRRRALQP